MTHSLPLVHPLGFVHLAVSRLARFSPGTANVKSLDATPEFFSEKQDLKSYGFPVSGDTITRRFGNWRKALARAHAPITEEAVSAETAPVEGAEAPRKRNVSLRKRFFVLKRDQFSCVRCGKSGVGVRLDVHHRFPFAKGGTDRLGNLETLCYDCNRGQWDSVV